jgi:hypothetical protein
MQGVHSSSSFSPFWKEERYTFTLFQDCVCQVHNEMIYNIDKGLEEHAMGVHRVDTNESGCR